MLHEAALSDESNVDLQLIGPFLSASVIYRLRYSHMILQLEMYSILINPHSIYRLASADVTLVWHQLHTGQVMQHVRSTSLRQDPMDSSTQGHSLKEVEGI